MKFAIGCQSNHYITIYKFRVLSSLDIQKSLILTWEKQTICFKVKPIWVTEVLEYFLKIMEEILWVKVQSKYQYLVFPCVRYVVRNVKRNIMANRNSMNVLMPIPQKPRNLVGRSRNLSHYWEKIMYSLNLPPETFSKRLVFYIDALRVVISSRQPCGKFIDRLRLVGFLWL